MERNRFFDVFIKYRSWNCITFVLVFFYFPRTVIGLHQFKILRNQNKRTWTLR